MTTLGLAVPDVSAIGTALIVVFLAVAALVVFLSYIGSHR